MKKKYLLNFIILNLSISWFLLAEESASPRNQLFENFLAPDCRTFLEKIKETINEAIEGYDVSRIDLDYISGIEFKDKSLLSKKLDQEKFFICLKKFKSYLDLLLKKEGTIQLKLLFHADTDGVASAKIFQEILSSYGPGRFELHLQDMAFAPSPRLDFSVIEKIASNVITKQSYEQDIEKLFSKSLNDASLVKSLSQELAELIKNLNVEDQIKNVIRQFIVDQFYIRFYQQNIEHNDGCVFLDLNWSREFAMRLKANSIDFNNLLSMDHHNDIRNIDLSENTNSLFIDKKEIGSKIKDANSLYVYLFGQALMTSTNRVWSNQAVVERFLKAGLEGDHADDLNLGKEFGFARNIATAIDSGLIQFEQILKMSPNELNKIGQSIEKQLDDKVKEYSGKLESSANVVGMYLQKCDINIQIEGRTLSKDGSRLLVKRISEEEVKLNGNKARILIFYFQGSTNGNSIKLSCRWDGERDQAEKPFFDFNRINQRFYEKDKGESILEEYNTGLQIGKHHIKLDPHATTIGGHQRASSLYITFNDMIKLYGNYLKNMKQKDAPEMKSETSISMLNQDAEFLEYFMDQVANWFDTIKISMPEIDRLIKSKIALREKTQDLSV